MSIPISDVKIPEDAPKSLLCSLHRDFTMSYAKKDNYEYVMSEFLRMSGIYWSLTAMDLLRSKECVGAPEEILKYVEDCFDERSGGFRPSPGHDPHLLYSLSAIQICATLESPNVIPKEDLTKFIVGLQNPDGSFSGDEWGEKDSRFSFCAVASLRLIHPQAQLDNFINLDKAIQYVTSCMNFDGGFGTRPGSESHAGNTYCCLGFLSLTDNLKFCNPDILGMWLAERQSPSGGLNGRPQKLPDVCYSWWVLASLAILGRLHWIDSEALSSFIYASQDSTLGGISDRPGDYSDPFHTLFGIAGLSLLGKVKEDVEEVNPVFCMSQKILDKMSIKTPTLPV